jgi:glycogen operon protein
VLALRTKQKRNFLATLFLSQGIPMLLGGDEFSRSQGGNNNAYCQDNEISWYDWKNRDDDFLEFVTRLIEFRKQHPVFYRRRYFQGRAIHGRIEDISWFKPDGEEMEEEHWGEGYAKAIGVFLNGEGIATPDLRGERVVDDTFYLFFNAHYETVTCTLPDIPWGREWQLLLDTSSGWVDGEDAGIYRARRSIEAEARSILLLKRSAR